jgi:nuclear transport factor 2 (NTF2) superfamily protein
MNILEAIENCRAWNARNPHALCIVYKEADGSYEFDLESMLRDRRESQRELSIRYGREEQFRRNWPPL